MHQLIELCLLYYNEFNTMRRNHEDLSILDFNRLHGLSIKVPEEWPVYDCLKEVSKHATQNKTKNIVCIYGTTTDYNNISNNMNQISMSPNVVSYVSWTEIYAAMNRSVSDTRMISSIRSTINNANLVFFVGASKSFQEVVDWVQGYCPCCLIILD